MLDLKIYKNGQYADLVVNSGWTIKKTLNEELDETTIMFSSTSADAIKLWQSVKAGDDYYIATYIQKDERPGRRWVYTVVLSEPTKYLEKVYCPAMSFTNKNLSLLEITERALLNAEPVEKEYQPRFKLTPSVGMRQYLADTAGADFYFDKMTLREILDGIFAKIDGRAYVGEITDYNDIIITCVSLAAKRNKIEIDSYTGRRTIESVEMLGSDIESYADNALVRVAGFAATGHLLPVYHPGINGWDTFKTNEAILTTENAVISTAYPIEDILMFFLPGPFKLRGLDINTGVYTELIVDDVVNISRNIMSKEEYDTLYEAKFSDERILTSAFYKENTIYYTRGEVDIRNIRSAGRWFGWGSMNNIEAAAKSAYWNSAAVRDEIAKGEYDSYDVKTDVDLSNIDKILFYLIYIPQLDAHLKIGKEGYAGPPATIISQQSDRQIDIERYGDNLYGQINRLGNEELEIDRVIEDKTELWVPGDYTEDNYILTTSTISIFNNFIKCHYQLTKDFNALSTKIGIDRQKRLYNIPLEYFRSDVIIKHYIAAWFGSPAVNDNLINTFMYTFKCVPFVGAAHITNVLIRTKWGPYLNDGVLVGPDEDYSDWLELAVVAYSAANTVNFQFRFKDNFSAGMSIGNQVIGGKRVIPNPYCNGLGEYEEIEIRLFNGLIKTATDNELARAKLLPKVSLNDYEQNGFLYQKTFMRIKDAYEHQSFTICFEIVSLENDDIIIGPALAQNCSLWQTLSPNLFVYISTIEKYHVGDKKVMGVKAANQNISISYGSVSVSFDETEITAWAIGDAAGNLFLACNRPAERGIQFFQKKKL